MFDTIGTNTSNSEQSPISTCNPLEAVGIGVELRLGVIGSNIGLLFGFGITEGITNIEGGAVGPSIVGSFIVDATLDSVVEEGRNVLEAVGKEDTEAELDGERVEAELRVTVSAGVDPDEAALDSGVFVSEKVALVVTETEGEELDEAPKDGV